MTKRIFIKTNLVGKDVLNKKGVFGIFELHHVLDTNGYHLELKDGLVNLDGDFYGIINEGEYNNEIFRADLKVNILESQLPSEARVGFTNIVYNHDSLSRVREVITDHIKIAKNSAKYIERMVFLPFENMGDTVVDTGISTFVVNPEVFRESLIERDEEIIVFDLTSISMNLGDNFEHEEFYLDRGRDFYEKESAFGKKVVLDLNKIPQTIIINSEKIRPKTIKEMLEIESNIELFIKNISERKNDLTKYILSNIFFGNYVLTEDDIAKHAEFIVHPTCLAMSNYIRQNVNTPDIPYYDIIRELLDIFKLSLSDISKKRDKLSKIIDNAFVGRSHEIDLDHEDKVDCVDWADVETMSNNLIFDDFITKTIMFGRYVKFTHISDEIKYWMDRIIYGDSSIQSIQYLFKAVKTMSHLLGLDCSFGNNLLKVPVDNKIQVEEDFLYDKFNLNKFEQRVIRSGNTKYLQFLVDTVIKDFYTSNNLHGYIINLKNKLANLIDDSRLKDSHAVINLRNAILDYQCKTTTDKIMQYKVLKSIKIENDFIKTLYNDIYKDVSKYSIFEDIFSDNITFEIHLQSKIHTTEEFDAQHIALYNYNVRTREFSLIKNFQKINTCIVSPAYGTFTVYGKDYKLTKGDTTGIKKFFNLYMKNILNRYLNFDMHEGRSISTKYIDFSRLTSNLMNIPRELEKMLEGLPGAMDSLLNSFNKIGQILLASTIVPFKHEYRAYNEEKEVFNNRKLITFDLDYNIYSITRFEIEGLRDTTSNRISDTISSLKWYKFNPFPKKNVFVKSVLDKMTLRPMVVNSNDEFMDFVNMLDKNDLNASVILKQFNLSENRSRENKELFKNVGLNIQTLLTPNFIRRSILDNHISNQGYETSIVFYLVSQMKFFEGTDMGNKLNAIQRFIQMQSTKRNYMIYEMAFLEYVDYLRSSSSAIRKIKDAIDNIDVDDYKEVLLFIHSRMNNELIDKFKSEIESRAKELEQEEDSNCNIEKRKLKISINKETGEISLPENITLLTVDEIFNTNHNLLQMISSIMSSSLEHNCDDIELYITSIFSLILNGVHPDKDEIDMDEVKNIFIRTLFNRMILYLISAVNSYRKSREENTCEVIKYFDKKSLGEIIKNDLKEIYFTLLQSENYDKNITEGFVKMVEIGLISILTYAGGGFEDDNYLIAFTNKEDVEGSVILSLINSSAIGLKEKLGDKYVISFKDFMIKGFKFFLNINLDEEKEFAINHNKNIKYSTMRKLLLNALEYVTSLDLRLMDTSFITKDEHSKISLDELSGITYDGLGYNEIYKYVPNLKLIKDDEIEYGDDIGALFENFIREIFVEYMNVSDREDLKQWKDIILGDNEYLGIELPTYKRSSKETSDDEDDDILPYFNNNKNKELLN